MRFELRDTRCGRRLAAQLLDKRRKNGSDRFGMNFHSRIAVEHPTRDAILRGGTSDERSKTDPLHDAANRNSQCGSLAVQ